MTTEDLAGMSPADAAAYWKARQLSGSMTGAEHASLRRWLEASDANRKAAADLDALLTTIDMAAVDLLTNEFERELSAAAGPERIASRRIGVVAAAIAATISAIVFVPLAVHTSGEYEKYATAIGEASKISLADGSVVELNTGTEFELSMTGSARTVRLTRGEAVFDVASDLNRPFVVRTRHADITATGTAFGVRTGDVMSSVFVVAGAVDVKPMTHAAMTVRAGEMAAIDQSGAVAEAGPFDPAYVLAWRTGKARFRETPLGDVVRELNRYFETPIVLAQPSLASMPITGDFDIRDQASAVEALTVIFSLESRNESSRIVLEQAQR